MIFSVDVSKTLLFITYRMKQASVDLLQVDSNLQAEIKPQQNH
jgi:hypothetical protein